MNIYQKLLEIQKKINGLGKDKSSFNFKYVTGSKVLEHIKPMMNELGLILKQEVLSIENTRQDYPTKQGNKSEILSKVMMRFTWIDCETGEKDENLFGANGQNDWDKGVGSALTYAERYFLLKFFHIATDEDDIDNPDRVTTPPVPLQPTIEVESDIKYLNVGTPEWTRAVELLTHGYVSKDGIQKEVTIADLRKKFRISSENQKLLQEQVLA